MKISIRKGVFETNSSSTHAICISKGEYDIRRSHITFVTGCFGWEWETYKTITERASYLITALECNHRDDLKLSMFKILEDNEITYDVSLTKEYYIDHAYETVSFIESVCNNEDLLLKYLFGEESMVLTGNDNSWDMEINYPSEEDYYIY